MNSFDSYRVRERAEIARLVLIGAFLVLCGRVLPDPGRAAREVPAPGRDQPAPPDPARRRRGARSSTATGEVIAENVPGYSVKLLRRRRLPPRRAGPGCAGRAAGQRASRRHPRAVPPARYQPALVFGDASFDVIARLEEHRTALPGLVIQAEPKRLYPAGKAVAHLVGLRRRGDRGRSRRQPLSRRRARLDRRARPDWSSSTTISLRGSEGVRYIEVNARGRMVREEAASAVAAADRRASPSAPPSTSSSSGSSTASGRRGRGARWWR